jgi:hypothetical protein
MAAPTTGLTMLGLGAKATLSRSSSRLFLLPGSSGPSGTLFSMSRKLIFDAGWSFAKQKKIGDFHKKYGKTSILTMDLRDPQFLKSMAEFAGLWDWKDRTSIIAVQQGITGLSTAKNIKDGMFEEAELLAETMVEFIEPMIFAQDGNPEPHWKQTGEFLPDYAPGMGAAVFGAKDHVLVDFPKALRTIDLRHTELCLPPGDWGNSWAVVVPATEVTSSVTARLYPYTTFDLLNFKIIQDCIFPLRNRAYRSYVATREEEGRPVPKTTDGVISVQLPDSTTVEKSRQSVTCVTPEVMTLLQLGGQAYLDEYGKYTL